jgi:hypothetical protein
MSKWKPEYAATQQAWRQRNRDKVREYQRRAEAKRPRTPREHYERHGRSWAIRTKYGISEEEYDRRLSQGCAICAGLAEVLDHDHATGEIRGPLCQECNRGVAAFRDDPGLLAAAIAYLGEDSRARLLG